MESLIVHPKNQMELNALKSVMKEMGIKFEKFHTRNTKNVSNSDAKPADTKKSNLGKITKKYPKKDL